MRLAAAAILISYGLNLLSFNAAWAEPSAGVPGGQDPLTPGMPIQPEPKVPLPIPTLSPTPTPTQTPQAPTSIYRSRAEKNELGLPIRPSAPPTLGATAPADIFVCQRYFSYRGRLLTCDSNVNPDGEGLRPILSTVPEAVPYLDKYQDNRRDLANLAYYGSAGLLIALGGTILSHQYSGGTRIVIRNISLFTGLLGLTAGSFIYGLTLLTTNESYLHDAVRVYNRSRPEDPLELQLTTGVRF